MTDVEILATVAVTLLVFVLKIWILSIATK